MTPHKEWEGSPVIWQKWPSQPSHLINWRDWVPCTSTTCQYSSPLFSSYWIPLDYQHNSFHKKHSSIILYAFTLDNNNIIYTINQFYLFTFNLGLVKKKHPIAYQEYQLLVYFLLPKYSTYFITIDKITIFIYNIC